LTLTCGLMAVNNNNNNNNNNNIVNLCRGQTYSKTEKISLAIQYVFLTTDLFFTERYRLRPVRPLQIYSNHSGTARARISADLKYSHNPSRWKIMNSEIRVWYFYPPPSKKKKYVSSNCVLGPLMFHRYFIIKYCSLLKQK